MIRICALSNLADLLCPTEIRIKKEIRSFERFSSRALSYAILTVCSGNFSSFKHHKKQIMIFIFRFNSVI